MVERKIILVNCYREKGKISNYKEFFERFGNVEIINDEDFKPVSEADIYIISGSEKYVSKNEFSPFLLEFLKNTDHSVIGICYGHHLIAKAFGARVEMGKRMIKKKERITVKKNDRIFAGLQEIFEVDESHKDHVVDTEEFNEKMDILAYSETCSIEAIKHKRKLIYGFQFHIERSGKSGEIIRGNIFDLLEKE